MKDAPLDEIFDDFILIPPTGCKPWDISFEIDDGFYHFLG